MLPLIVWAIAVRTPTVPRLSWVTLAAGILAVLQWMVGQVLFHGDAAMVLLYWWGLGLATIAGATVVDATYRDRSGVEVHPGQASLPVRPLSVLTPHWVAIVLACIVSLGVIVHQWLDLSMVGLYIVDLKPGARPYGNLAQPNQLSTLFFLGLLGAAFLFEARYIRTATGLMAALVMCAGLVITQSRAALLITVWLLVVYFALRKRSALRIHPSIPIIWTATYGGLSMAWPSINHWLLISDNTIRAIDRTTPGQRAIYWRSMLDAIMDYPLWGFGFQQVNMAQRATALDYPPTYGFFESSHNLVLDLMGWAGLPFALLVLVCIAIWFVGQWRRVSDGLAWATLAAVGVLGVHSMVEFPLYYAYFLMPVGLWVGALSARCRTPTTMGNISLTSIQKPVWLGAALTCAVLFVWVTDEYVAWEEDWRTALFEEMGYVNTPPPVVRSVVLLDQIGDYLWFSRYKVRPDMPVADVLRAQRLAERESNAMVMFKYAKVAALNGDSGQATHYLRLYQSLHSRRAYAQAHKDWVKAAEAWPQLQHVTLPEAEPEPVFMSQPPE